MSCAKVEASDERIDMERLKVRDKISFYSDVILFEDELHDSGCSVLSVKIVCASFIDTCLTANSDIVENSTYVHMKDPVFDRKAQNQEKICHESAGNSRRRSI